MANTESEELWQAYDELGQPIDSQGLTRFASRQGALHAASHVWMWRRRAEADNVEVLLQRRGLNKQTWPGYFDISAAGHIRLGESPIHAAIRETLEEVGLTIRPENLKLLFVHRMNVQVEDTGMVENEFQWVYGLEEMNVDDRLQTDEVESLQWMSLADFKQLALPQSNQPSGKKVVPHSEGYFLVLLEALARVSE